MRRLAVLVRHLPPTSSTSHALVGSVPSTEAQLLAQIWELVAHAAGGGKGKAPKHPLLEATRSTVASAAQMAPERRRALMAARARARERRRKIATGEIT